MTRRWIAMVLMVVATSVPPGCSSTAETSASFDSAAWKAPGAHQPPYVRRELADALVSGRLLKGRSRAEVDELLGPPDETPHFSGYDLVYWLGPERGLIAADSEWLVIRFDEADTVAEYEIKAD